MLSSSQFMFNTSSNLFISEISELGGFEQIWNDSCDLGFTVFSAKTGRSSKWYINETVRDAFGDVTHWNLLPALESIRANPGLEHTKMVVYND